MAGMFHGSNSFPMIVPLVLLTLGLASTTSANGRVPGGSGFCPKICTCDLIDGLKRADCSNEKLINAYNDVPYGVEILDLSINIISSIEDDDFKPYESLVKLFLSENSIQTISLDAFSNQRRLTTLDLSHNRLEHLNEQVFERNELLVELNLSHNNFMMLPDKPFLKSYSISFLHLSDCRIPHVFDTMFIDLPNLQWLDLTQNIMNTLATVPFAHLRKLNSIHLSDNRWNCKSDGVRSTIRWMKNRIPNINVESCLLADISYHGNKFERLQEDPSLAEAARDLRQDVAIEEVWGKETKRHQPAKIDDPLWPKLMNQSCKDPSDESCDQFRKCQRKYSDLHQAYSEVLPTRDYRNCKHHRYETFLGGLLVGLLCGSFTTYTICWAFRSCRNRRARRRASEMSDPGARGSEMSDHKRLQRELRKEFRDRNRFEHTRLNESPVFPRSERFPGSARRSAAQQQEEIYRNHEHTRQFLVNLFSKRQPRYVRSNSQLANINNRYIPPTQTREPREENPVVLRAASHSGEVWVQENDHAQQQTSTNDPGDAFRHNIDQQPTWISIRTMAPGGTLTRNSRARSEIPTSGDSPPPPYGECTLNEVPREERAIFHQL